MWTGLTISRKKAEELRENILLENKRKIGQDNENAAAEYLKQQGYEILAQNFYTRMGEIDLIARDDEYLVFVEVKYRRSASAGYPEESVTRQKQQRIIRTARYYMLKNKITENTPCRFDVLAIEGTKIRLIKNAFGI